MNKLIFSRMCNHEYYTSTERLLKTLGDFNTEEMGLDSFLTEIESSHKLIDAVMLKQRSFLNTPDLLAGIDTRNHCYSMLRYYVLSYGMAQDEATQKGYRLAERHVKLYGKDLYRMGQSAGQSNMSNFLSGIDQNAELKAAFELLKADDWITALRESHNVCLDLAKKRVQEVRNRPTVDPETAREAVQNSIELLLLQLELKQRMGADEQFANLCSDVDTVISEINFGVKQRIATSGTEVEATEPTADSETGELVEPELELDYNTV